jgi:hypothetical protein
MNPSHELLRCENGIFRFVRAIRGNSATKRHRTAMKITLEKREEID